MKGQGHVGSSGPEEAAEIEPKSYVDRVSPWEPVLSAEIILSCWNYMGYDLRANAARLLKIVSTS